MLIRLTATVSKLLFGDSSKESIIEIPQGQLYLVRPLSVKGYSELIFKDAAASIRRTGQEFQYQLVIQRAYEEGERELLEEEEDPDNVEGTGLEKDERTFLLDEALRLRTDVRSTGEQVFAWKDLSGDEGDLWEFVCDSSVQASTIASFELVAVQCQYERKFRKSHTNATEQDLKQFSFEEEAIPDASPVSSPRIRSPTTSPSPDLGRSSFSLDQPAATIDTMVSKPAPQPESSKKATAAPESRPQPEAREVLSNERAELHLFDFESGAFILQDQSVTATVSEIGNWDYWLHIAGDDKEWLGQPVVPDVNPVFNFEYLSFIFNHYTEDGSAYSWLLRFKDQETEERFQQGLMQALWEHLNQVKWAKTKDDERDYVLEAFNDLTVEDEQAGEEEEEDEDDEEEEDRPRARSEESDEDDDEDDAVPKEADGNVNSQLAVGYKHDRSFVVRGHKIGVFKHTDDNHLEFSTNISKVETPKGKLFSPKKVMLHMEDRDMILQNPDNPNSLYRMDLERGQVVDEWKIHEDIPLDIFAPEKVLSLCSDLHVLNRVTDWRIEIFANDG